MPATTRPRCLALWESVLSPQLFTCGYCTVMVAYTRLPFAGCSFGRVIVCRPYTLVRF